MTNDDHPIRRLESRGPRRGATAMADDVVESLTVRRRRRVGAILAAAMFAIAGIGIFLAQQDEEPAVTLVDQPEETTTAPTSITTTTITTLSIPPDPEPFVAAECATGVDRFASAQFAFGGEITAVEMRVNPRDVDPENPAFDPDAAPPLTPWVTFRVRVLFDGPSDTNRVWMPGLDPVVGQSLLVAGDAYVTHLENESPHSGEVDPCLAEPDSARAKAEWDAVFGGSVDPESTEPEGPPDADQVARIQAALDQWLANKPKNYSVEISTNGSDDPFGEECGTGGNVRVAVIDGVVEQAVNLSRYCEINPSLAPTVEEVFENAMALTGATEFQLTLDEDDTLISFWASDRSVEAGGTVANFSLDTGFATAGENDAATNPRIAAALAVWQDNPVTDYELRVEPRCFCPTGAYVSTVVDGETVGAVLEEDGSPYLGIDDDQPWRPATIDDAYELLATYNSASWKPAGATGSRYVVVFDPTERWPTRIWLDPIVNAIDDEQELVITLTPSS